MYCRYCGKQIQPQAVVCITCGCPVGQGGRYCYNCGKEMKPGADVCLNCGCGASNQTVAGQKSKLAAGLLGILLGVFGVHNFYLGYTSKAVAQLLLGTVGGLVCGLGFVASGIWGLVEGIMILTGSINVDGEGKPLGD